MKIFYIDLFILFLFLILISSALWYTVAVVVQSIIICIVISRVVRCTIKGETSEKWEKEKESEG